MQLKKARDAKEAEAAEKRRMQKRLMQLKKARDAKKTDTAEKCAECKGRRAHLKNKQETKEREQSKPERKE